ncbi:hypothetical protein N9Y92_03995, partial [Chlamydiales bacterium]|nr:hypothetical protein [Chlamydiales bacterium]
LSSIDRGPTATALQYLENEELVTSEKIRKVATIANAFAPLVQGRPPHQDRISRLKNAAKHFGTVQK